MHFISLIFVHHHQMQYKAGIHFKKIQNKTMTINKKEIIEIGLEKKTKMCVRIERKHERNWNVSKIQKNLEKKNKTQEQRRR